MSTAMVVKVGGSLLIRPDLPQTLRRWLSDHAVQQQVNVLVGGGAMIDALRELDHAHPFDDVAMHWRCVRALRHTMELVAEWLPEATVVDTPEAFHRHCAARRQGVFLLAADAFYHPLSGDAMPCDWSTTSDSIAALLARKLSAKRLVLLKSCEIAQQLTIAAATKQGIVDPVFQTVIDDSIAIELQSF